MRIILQPRETMKLRRAKQQLAIDADLVHSAIRSAPGIGGKCAIAAVTGLSPRRVAEVIHRINADETGHARLEYGAATPTGGPNAGRETRGWYVMNRKDHHPVMDQADEHEALTEVGVRRARLVRYAQAAGIRGAEAVVAQLEHRLGLSIDAMSQSDLEAFEELLSDPELIEP